MFANYPITYIWQNQTIYSATQLGWLITGSRCVIDWSISLDGTDPDASPVQVDVVRGSGNPSSGVSKVGVQFDGNSPSGAAPISAAFQVVGGWAESGTLESHFVHPAGGVLTREYPLPQLYADRILLSSSTNYVGLAVRVASDTTVASMTLTLAEQM